MEICFYCQKLLLMIHICKILIMIYSGYVRVMALIHGQICPVRCFVTKNFILHLDVTEKIGIIRKPHVTMHQK